MSAPLEPASGRPINVIPGVARSGTAPILRETAAGGLPA